MPRRCGRAPAATGQLGQIGSAFRVAASASWVPDLWGRVRANVSGAAATAQASAADLAAARLAAQSQLASAYMQIRVADELRRLLDATANAYAELLRISQNQYNAGIVSAADVAQAKTQLESTRARAEAVGVTRARLENAIAVLIGNPPSELGIAPAPGLPALPEIPAGLPSSLLERRPDIAAAERRMAAANAAIGVAGTAFYPDITLSATGGTAATEITKLALASGWLWSFGTTLAQTVFDAGARHAQVEQAVAIFDRSVALYRQTVLDALRDVEDQLSALRLLKEPAIALEAAVTASREAERIISNQYLAGTVSYTSCRGREYGGAQQCGSGARCDADPAAGGGGADRGAGRRLGGRAAAEPRAPRGTGAARISTRCRRRLPGRSQACGDPGLPISLNFPAGREIFAERLPSAPLRLLTARTCDEFRRSETGNWG